MKRASRYIGWSGGSSQVPGLQLPYRLISPPLWFGISPPPRCTAFPLLPGARGIGLMRGDNPRRRHELRLPLLACRLRRWSVLDRPYAVPLVLSRVRDIADILYFSVLDEDAFLRVHHGMVVDDDGAERSVPGQPFHR